MKSFKLFFWWSLLIANENHKSTKHDFQHWNIKRLKNMLIYTLCWKLLLLVVSHRFSVGLRSDTFGTTANFLYWWEKKSASPESLSADGSVTLSKTSRVTLCWLWLLSLILQTAGPQFPNCIFYLKRGFLSHRETIMFIFFKPNTSDVMSGLGLVMLGMMWL